jgi:hypothetical protein
MYQNRRRLLLLIGWLIFLSSCVLPESRGHGGLSDPENSVVGLLTLFYSFIAVAVLFDASLWINAKGFIDTAGFAVTGPLNLLMLCAPALLLLRGKAAVWARRVMVFGALYVCTVGFWVNREFTLLFGHYVWCFSFIVVAVALSMKREQLA